MTAKPVNRFVRSAWSLLVFQLLAAAAAVAVTAWAAFQVKPLLEERASLTVEVSKLNTTAQELRKESEALKAEQEQLNSRLANARQATDYVSRAINQYHTRDYAGAIRNYDEALRLDPENSYVLDLKSYSQFRAGDVPGAIETVKAALAFRPDYIYGYSELSRYACAAGDFEQALTAFNNAKARSPDAAGLYSALMRDDGQFNSLCRQVGVEFMRPSGALVTSPAPAPN